MTNIPSILVPFAKASHIAKSKASGVSMYTPPTEKIGSGRERTNNCEQRMESSPICSSAHKILLLLPRYSKLPDARLRSPESGTTHHVCLLLFSIQKPTNENDKLSVFFFLNTQYNTMVEQGHLIKKIERMGGRYLSLFPRDSDILLSKSCNLPTLTPLATVSLQFLSRLSIVSVNFYPRIWGGLLQIRARLHNKMASSSKFTDAYRITLVFSGKVRDS